MLPTVCFLVSILVPIMSTPTIGRGQWITKYEVRDLRSGVPATPSFNWDEFGNVMPVLEGGECNITLTANVTITVPNSVLTLTTNLEHSTVVDRYWELRTRDYPVIDYNPNRPYVKFHQIKGILTLSLYGKVPQKITEESIDGIVLHKVRYSYIALELRSPSNETLDSIEFDVADNAIYDCRNLLKAKKDVLDAAKNGGVTRKYTDLFEQVIARAKIEANEGFINKANSLLNLLPSEIADLPKEPSASFMETMFIPTVGGLAVGVMLIGLLFVRSKSRLNYILSVLGDQIKELEGLTVKASKVDKLLSTNLDSIKEKLKSLVGM